MKNFLSVFIASVLLFSCDSEIEKQKTDTVEFVDTVNFFGYVNKMNNELDSIIRRNDIVLLSVKSDSSKEFIQQIDSLQVKTYAQEFFSKDITKMPLKQFYDESIFTDLTTNSTIISYATSKDSLPIKKVDVLINAANGEEVKRIDMKLIYAEADSIITENYAWVFGKSFYKNRYAEANGKGVASTVKLSWIKKSK